MTIIGSRQVLPRDSIIFRPGPVDMYIDPPIPTAGLTDNDIEALMHIVRARMVEKFEDSRQESVDSSQ